MTQTDPRVTVSIVTWNSRQHLRTCFEALERQTYTSFQILVVDNASADGTVAWLEEHYPQINILRNTRNFGYCRAHNQAIRLTKSDFVLVLNADVVLAEDWITRAVTWMDNHPETGSYGGLLGRYTYSSDELKEVNVSAIIDSAGLRLDRQRHAVDRGSGQAANDQFRQAEEVFGFSGACVLHRRTALDSVAFQQQVFYEPFFAYKDDVDLAWRLQRLGWQAWFDPAAKAWHHREIQGVDSSRNSALAKNYRRRKSMIASLSYRNHWAMLLTYESWSTWWRDGLLIAWYEFRKAGFLLVTRPRVLRGFFIALSWWPALQARRRWLAEHAKRSSLAVRQAWIR